LICQHIKKSRLKLDHISNDLLLDLVIVLWRNNFKSIPCIEEYQRSHSCCSCTIADTKQSSGDSCCTIVLFQRSPKNKHPMPSNSFELAVALGFYSFAQIGAIITTFEQSFEASRLQLLNLQNLWWLQLLMSSLWWECFWWRQLQNL